MIIKLPRIIKLPNLATISIPSLTLWLIFIVSPYVDAITGYLVNSGMLTAGGIGSPSQLFRFMLTAFMLIQIRQVKHWKILLFMLLWIMGVEALNLINHTTLSWLILGAVYAYKLVFGVIAYLLFTEYFEQRELTFSKLENLIITMTATYAIIILICNILGVSFAAYPGAELGSKGPYASANGLGVFLGTASFVVLNKYVYLRQIKTLLIYLLTIIVLLGLMTKAGVLFAITGLFILALKQNKWVKFTLITTISTTILLFWEKIWDLIQISFHMIIWRIERSDSIWEILLGGRDQYLKEMASYNYDTTQQITKLAIGGGYKLSFRDPNSIYYDPNGIFIIEADFFDVFFMYGGLGLILYLGILISGFTTKSNKGINPLKWGWAILFIHSTLAGHVMSNGAALIIIPCIMILLQKYHSNYTTKVLLPNNKIFNK